MILIFLTAVQVQESWARSLGVNLLAANYHLPEKGLIGSGIYNSAGAINFISSPDSGTRLLIANVNSSQEKSSPSPSATKYDKLLLTNSRMLLNFS